MAYVPLDESVPDAATQSIAEVTTSVRENVEALRDAIIRATGGDLPGWDWELQDSDGTPATDPAEWYQCVFSRGTERIKLVAVWGTSGGADGNPLTIVGYYSSNSGTNYDLIADTDAPLGKITYSYDANGYCISQAWS